MFFDKNRYARTKLPSPLPVCVYDARTCLINQNTGFDMKYQENKVFNLRLAAEPINGIVIRPQESFSFWQLVKKVRRAAFKEGLSAEYGKLVTVKGGGLCHLSNFLFWMFLHTPLTIQERHPHHTKDFPSPDKSEPDGVDATVSEGWLDLKVRNQTALTLQISLNFDGPFMYGRILANGAVPYRYKIFNRDKMFFKEAGKVFEQVSVCRQSIDPQSGRIHSENQLYTDVFEIGYTLPDETELQEMKVS
jgi:vancomycin resistance protein VanW